MTNDINISVKKMTSKPIFDSSIVSQDSLKKQPVKVILPLEQTAPVVFCSPHSGRQYPDEFLEQSKLDLPTLRSAEDFFVDYLFASVSEFGAPFLSANFPRVYIDPNREPYELDPTMFDDSLPAFANTSSTRVAGGLGVLTKIVGEGQEIYGSKLTFSQAQWRIQNLYLPYHRKLSELIRRTQEKFGFVILIDCHSMPSSAGPYDHGEFSVRPDIILGDRFGTSCAPIVSRTLDRLFCGLSYRVTRNNPYAGGYVTDHYGRPGKRVHALQIELNRRLYMNEKNQKPTENMATLMQNIRHFTARLIREVPNMMTMFPEPSSQSAAE